jgi:hypothetical protein
MIGPAVNQLLKAHRIRRCLQFLAIGVMVLSVSHSIAAKSADPCARLPKSVLKQIQVKFPGWRPKQLSDLDPDARLLWDAAHGGECPGVAVGHFESANQLGYAVLLAPQVDPVGGFKLVAFEKGAGSDAYGWQLIDEWNAHIYSGAVISKAPPGKYSQADNPAISVTTMLDGVYFGEIDKGAVLYYWSDGRFQKLILSA